MKNLYLITTLMLYILILANPANAYIGPGMGVGVFLVFLAFVIGFFLFIIALIWFPLKRKFFSKRNQNKSKE